MQRRTINMLGDIIYRKSGEVSTSPSPFAIGKMISRRSCRTEQLFLRYPLLIADKTGSINIKIDDNKDFLARCSQYKWGGFYLPLPLRFFLLKGWVNGCRYC